MAGYIGANTSSVTNNQNAAERRKKFTFTANTTVLSGLNFAPAKIHIFHNGIRLVKDTDYTEAADGKSVTLTNAAQAGDEVVAVTFAQDPASNTDFVSASTGGTFSGDVTMASGTTLDASAGLTTPAGHIIQVQSGLLDYMQSTTASFSTIGSLSITPTSASSKILILFENHIFIENLSTNAWRGANVRLLRDSTFIYGDSSTGYGHAMYVESDGDRSMLYSTRSYLDSPNTTSSVTYNVQGLSRNGVVSISFNYDTYGGQGRITLMEIAQ